MNYSKNRTAQIIAPLKEKKNESTFQDKESNSCTWVLGLTDIFHRLLFLPINIASDWNINHLQEVVARDANVISHPAE